MLVGWLAERENDKLMGLCFPVAGIHLVESVIPQYPLNAFTLVPFCLRLPSILLTSQTAAQVVIHPCGRIMLRLVLAGGLDIHQPCIYLG